MLQFSIATFVRRGQALLILSLYLAQTDAVQIIDVAFPLLHGRCPQMISEEKDFFQLEPLSHHKWLPVL